MNSVQRIIRLSSQRMFIGNRPYSGSKDLSEDEKKKLYQKLMQSKYNEKITDSNSFIKFVMPDASFSPPRIMSYDWSLKSIFNWFIRKRIEFYKHNQRYLVERVKALGSDIAIAHFIVYRGGAVKFRGQDYFIQWENTEEEYFANLPTTYDPNYFVEAIDASNLMLFYEGIENFQNLYKLKWLSLRNNLVLDNWSLDYIAYALPQLEYLDICDCPQVTAAGIGGLQKLRHLKELVINTTNIEIQMACFALEDTIPGLYVIILDDYLRFPIKRVELCKPYKVK